MSRMISLNLGSARTGSSSGPGLGEHSSPPPICSSYQAERPSAPLRSTSGVTRRRSSAFDETNRSAIGTAPKRDDNMVNASLTTLVGSRETPLALRIADGSTLHQ